MTLLDVSPLVQLSVGESNSPVILIDNAFADFDILMKRAFTVSFQPEAQFYPGVRAQTPPEYQRWLIDLFNQQLLPRLVGKPSRANLISCNYSVITRRPEALHPLQTVPHVDSTQPLDFAVVHYLNMGGHGGTAFYRHRATGLERIQADTLNTFSQIRTAEMRESTQPPSYIVGDTEHYKKIGEIEGVVNRLAVYPQNLLHSGLIKTPFEDPSQLANTRLSINAFITAELT